MKESKANSGQLTADNWLQNRICLNERLGREFPDGAVISRVTGLAKGNATHHRNLPANKEFPKDELYGLTSQLRRAAVSVPSNIAEGHGRLSNREFTQFMSVARGSVCELQTQLEIARSLGFGTIKAIEEAERLSHEVGKMIFAFLGSLKNQPARTSSTVNR